MNVILKLQGTKYPQTAFQKFMGYLISIFYVIILYPVFFKIHIPIIPNHVFAHNYMGSIISV